MDPLTTAALIVVSKNAITTIAAAAMKADASAIARATWEKVKKLVGWDSDPKPADVPALAEAILRARPQLAQEVETIYQEFQQQAGGISVEQIRAKNVVLGNNNFQGPVNFS